ncbi:hypothetical protein BGZ67_006700 [Mortierella alpina]|nr:hypothetical protein BGZ67_006700 [Mortierella alpina]
MLAMTGPPPVTACASCKRSHIKCDSGRPCLNCLKHPSKAMTCRDAVPKPRGRPKGGSKAAAEALMMAKMQHPISQPGLVPRPRVMSPPHQQKQKLPHMPLHHQQPPHHQQQQRQPAYSSEPLLIVSRSSPTSPAAIEHRAIRSNRRPSLPTWHHPYAVTSPTPASAITSSAMSTYAPMVPGQLFFSSGETPEAFSMAPFPRPQSMSSLPSSTRSSFSSAPIPTSMTAADMYHSLTAPSVAMAPPPSLHQGLEGMQFLQQQPQQQHLSATGLLRSQSASSSLSPVALSSATGACNSLEMGLVEERVMDQEQHNMTALLENQRKVEAELQRMQHHQQLLLQQEHQKQQALVRLSMQQRKQQQQQQQQQQQHQLQFQLHQAQQQQQAQQ